MACLRHDRHGLKIGGLCPFFWGGELAVCENVNKSSAVAEMGDRLATIEMGRKLEVCLFYQVVF